MKKKTMGLLIALVLVLTCAVGGTLAWLSDQSGPVKNTFTVGDIQIELDEAKVNVNGQFLDKNDNVVTDIEQAERITTGNSYNIVPGFTYTKDPTVTLKGGSEACYVFIEVARSANYNDVITTNIDGSWTRLVDATTEVYYKEFASKVTADTEIAVLAGNSVTVKTDVEKDKVTSEPTIEFTAYAVQLFENNNTKFTPKAAWELAKK